MNLLARGVMCVAVEFCGAPRRQLMSVVVMFRPEDINCAWQRGGRAHSAEVFIARAAASRGRHYIYPR